MENYSIDSVRLLLPCWERRERERGGGGGRGKERENERDKQIERGGDIRKERDKK